MAVEPNVLRGIASVRPNGAAATARPLNGTASLIEPIRDLGRKIDRIGEQAVRCASECATEIANDATRAVGRLRSDPTCDGVNDVLAVLNSFERIPSLSSAPAIDRALRLQASIAITAAKSLFEQLAEAEANVGGEIDLASVALDLAVLAGRTPPPRRYAWAPWIPARMSTLLHSYGGLGKSLLGQQIATAYVLGLDLFGGATEGRPALVLAGEDDHDEVWRRQLDICRRLGARLEDVIGKLDLLAVPHLDVTLATGSDAGVLTTTRMLDALRQRIERGRHGLILLDNSAKLFAVREGDRIGVTRCVGLLNAICQDFDTTAVLVAHDNKAGEYSGSTAWENTCRSRLHLTRDEDGSITMAMPKAN